MSLSVKVRIGIVLIISLPSILGIGIIATNQLNLASLAEDNRVIQPVTLNETLFVDASRDVVEFEQISLEGDILTMKISYSGSNNNHIFELIGSGDFLESAPIQTTLVLSHDAKGDLGESLKTKTLLFDLEPLKETLLQTFWLLVPTDSLLINLESFGEITYMI